MTDAPRPGPSAAIGRRHFLKLAFGTTAAAAALARPRLLHPASGDLRLGAWAGAGGQDLLEGYQRESGTGLKSNPHPSNEAILAALRSGADYDVVVLTAYAVAEGVAEGLIQPLDRSRLTNFDSLPVEFRDGRRPHDPEDAFSAPKSWGTTGILYRTDAFGEPPATWADFWTLAERNPGRAYIIDSAPEVIDAALYKLGHPPTESEPRHLEQARAELMALQRNLGGIDSDCAARIGSGEGLLALTWSTDVEPLVAAGLPVGFVIPQEGSEIWEDDFCIPSSAGDVPAAHDFIDYMLGTAPPSLPSLDLPYDRLFAHTPLEAELTAAREQIWSDLRAA